MEPDRKVRLFAAFPRVQSLPKVCGKEVEGFVNMET
jgi:hypothetical protein